MSYLSQEELAVHRAKLERLGATIDQTLRGMTSHDLYQETQLLLRRVQIRDALSRIRRGVFGICVGCGGARAPAQLDHDPVVAYCAVCAPAHGF